MNIVHHHMYTRVKNKHLHSHQHTYTAGDVLRNFDSYLSCIRVHNVVGMRLRGS